MDCAARFQGSRSGLVAAEVKIIRPLYNLAMGILEALQGMVWVIVFTVMGLYATGIVCTRMIGHGALFEAMEITPDPDVRRGAAPSAPPHRVDPACCLADPAKSWSGLDVVVRFLMRPARDHVAAECACTF